jgi:hypothetical protein
MSPAKVATKLQKLAELQLFNQTMANDYLTRNAACWVWHTSSPTST